MNPVEWWRRVWYLLNRRRFDEALRNEMDVHRSLMDDPRRFGNALRLREVSQDVWGWAWGDYLVRDIRFALRAFHRSRGFTVTAVFSLGLGFAVTASTIAVVNAYLIRSLPYPAAHRLYHVRYTNPGQPEPRGLTALDWSALSDVIEVPVTTASEIFYLTDGAYTQAAPGLLATRQSIDALGGQVTIGRLFTMDDVGTNVALIAQSLWRDRFGSDPHVIGRQFRAYTANQAGPTETFQVVGVLSPAFWYIREGTELIMPLRSTNRTYMVRLREHVPVAAAEQRLTAAVKRTASLLPPNWVGVRLENVHDEYVSRIRPILFAVSAAAALVLFVVAANVGVLMLLRTLRREHELTVRLALGAGRRQIVRLLLVEVCVIVSMALAVSLGATQILLRLLAPLIEAQLGRDAPGGASAIRLDPTVLMIVAAAGLVTVGAMSIFPLLAPWRRRAFDVAPTHTRGGGSDSRRMQPVRSMVIAVEVGASLALLVGSGLMIRTVINLSHTDLGYRTQGIVRSRIVPPGRSYPDAEALARFYEAFTERLAAANTPVVLANWPPLAEPIKQPAVTDTNPNTMVAGVVAVSPGYFDTLNIDLTAGRDFTRADRLGSPPVAIVSASLAAKLWPNGSPIGARIRTADRLGYQAPAGEWRVIVGVARDIRHTYTDKDLNDIYLPFFQAPNRFAPLYVRTDRSPTYWLDTLRSTVADIDPEVTINGANSLQSEADRLLAGTRFLTTILSAFALSALFLAVLGIYGVVAYGVEQRQREIAIRMAVGATGESVIRLFLRSGAVVIGAGLACGLVAAWGVSKMLATQLYDVQPFDARTLLAACTVLSMCGLLATWWPARRGVSQDPVVALKEN